MPLVLKGARELDDQVRCLSGTISNRLGRLQMLYSTAEERKEATGRDKDGSGLATCSFRNARLCDAYHTYLPPAENGPA